MKSALIQKLTGGCPLGLAVDAHTICRAAKLLGMGEQDEQGYPDRPLIPKP